VKARRATRILPRDDRSALVIGGGLRRAEARPGGEARMSQISLQLLLAALLIGATTTVQALFVGLALALRPRIARRAGRFRHWGRAAMVGLVALWMLLGQTAGVGLWTSVLLWLGAFAHFEEALYFAIVSYTSVGYGDLVAAPDWRILGASIAANGMLGFGIATAALIDFVQRTRTGLGH
jgi:hypothetical protein